MAWVSSRSFETDLVLAYRPTRFANFVAVPEHDTTTGDRVPVRWEIIRFGERFEQQDTVVATKVCRRTERGWKMVIHHASPDPNGVTRSVPDRETMH